MGSKNKNKKKSSSINNNNGAVVVDNGDVPEQRHDEMEQEEGVDQEEQEEEEEEELGQTEDKDLIIEELKKQVEELKISQDQKIATNDEVEILKNQLEQKTRENEQNETNYQNLLSKLSGMKALFSKMKQGEAELEASEVEKAKLQKDLLQSEDEKRVLISTIKDLKKEVENLNAECVGLNERLNNVNAESVSGQEEVEKLTNLNKQLQGQVKELKTNQEEYLIMMNEEKLLRQNLSNEILDLKQMLEYKDNEINGYINEKSNLNDKLTKLEENLVRKSSELDIKDAQYTNDLKNLENQLQMEKLKILDLETKLEQDKEEIIKLSKLEKENKDKQLQIGKLRHEAIILNDHLTKALKLIKKDSSNDSVDKELVSNLFISFLNLPRGDSKKFQALELIANYLNWDKDMRVHAGIENKTSKGDDANRSRQSFVSLWTEYLEKESTKEQASGKLDST